MDLVTLVTACALVVEPKIMHALIWHQSGGEPWSFSVPGEHQPQVYHTVRDAIGGGAGPEDPAALRRGPEQDFIGACPDCGSQLAFTEGCAKCHVCGFSECG